MAKRKSRRKNKPEASMDLTSLLLIIFGIVFSFIIYSSDKGIIGNFIYKMIFGGLVRKTYGCNPNNIYFFRNLYNI